MNLDACVRDYGPFNNKTLRCIGGDAALVFHVYHVGTYSEVCTKGVLRGGGAQPSADCWTGWANKFSAGPNQAKKFRAGAAKISALGWVYVLPVNV